MFLILATPFINFVTNFDYAIHSFECLIVLVSLAFISVILSFVANRGYLAMCIVYTVAIVLFIDIQVEFAEEWKKLAFGIPVLAFGIIWIMRQHISVVLVACFVVMNASSLSLAIGDAIGSSVQRTGDLANRKTDKPSILHLILDEHIAVEGIPLDIRDGEKTKEDIKTFYQLYDFKVFGGAYSRYFNSHNSIASMLDFERSPDPRELYEQGNSHTYSLKQNAYFAKMHAEGYRIRVYQSNYMDFCDAAYVDAADCFTYQRFGLRPLDLSSLGVGDRVFFLARMYTKLSFAISKSLETYEYLRSRSGSIGAYLPSWAKWDGIISPIATMKVIDTVMTDIEKDRGGQMYFVHLLLPHFPYIYNSDCTIREPLFEWKSPFKAEANKEIRPTQYPLYFDQIHCTNAKLKEMFDRIDQAGHFDNWIVLVHGDHGSRITQTWLPHKDKKSLSREDLVEGFSTLFAVKGLGYEAGYDKVHRPLAATFEQVINEKSMESVTADEQYVFFEAQGKNVEHKDRWLKVSYPVPEHAQ